MDFEKTWVQILQDYFNTLKCNKYREYWAVGKDTSTTYCPKWGFRLTIREFLERPPLNIVTKQQIKNHDQINSPYLP